MVSRFAFVMFCLCACSGSDEPRMVPSTENPDGMDQENPMDGMSMEDATEDEIELPPLAEISPELFGNWPAGSAPEEVGSRVIENFLSRPFRYQEGATAIILYRESLAWYGSLQLAAIQENQPLLERIVARFDPMLTPEGAGIVPPGATVDDRVFGIVPLQIFMQTMDERYLTIGQGLADRQWMSTSADGITTEA